MVRSDVITDEVEWQALCNRTFVPLEVSADGPFAGSATLYHLGDTLLVEVTNTSTTACRTRQLIRDHPRDLVMVDVHVRGDGSVSDQNRANATDGTSVVLCEANRPYQLRFAGASNVLALVISRSRLALSGDALAEAHARVHGGTDAASTVLRHLLRGVVAGGILHGNDSAIVADAAISLVTSIVRPMARDDRKAGVLDDAAAYSAVCGVFLARYADPDLTVDVVAKSHHMSRRCLELVFARRGDSPAAHLRRIRMVQARRSLESIAPPGVAEVAYRVGYRDTTSFIRAYRRHHQETPGVTRARRFSLQVPSIPHPPS